ncbi:hypothetical protein CEUSTIGMA_g10864.t1 [Chlamydomonas eustigma]|uniref:WW domain-containing protein n=1 Tax=Chlamydomonas eustigma TaxID=1157962 RepID=A0A250XKI1_9CHLO|nr:hypothetical protein CEUSTIGMA_g10864.t1 [Chlamydomonas eustigma]|eukprot:GAX83439.1 hypothetical protein CEUSTIGMA_g10864.t1 [Chlamydomonas eustigma]
MILKNLRNVLFGLLLFSCIHVSLSVDAANTKITIKLVETIQKKNYEAFVKELSVNGMDVNQPTPKGLLPILEAVKIKGFKFVDALIQFGVEVNAKEPGSEVTALYLAAQANAVDIVRLLLAYGADPKATSKSGKSAADLMTLPALKDLLTAWEKSGAMAFEDAPGAWIKTKEDEKEYWFNKMTNEGRWNMPPSCAWQRVEVKGGPSEYVNYVTSQVVYQLPPALSWRKVRASGEDLWYNWKSNITQREQPDEMPQYMLEEAASLTNVRWFNEKTQQYSWEDPKTTSHWRPVEEDGKTYYFNLITGESQWEMPDDVAWSKHEHEGSHYYHNSQTGENTWDVPAHEAWVVQNSDL